MRAVEQALLTELASLPESVRVSALAVAARGLAQALDAEPADQARVLLTRELRFALADLRGRAPKDDASDVEQFLAAIAEPKRGDTAGQ
jgi:hypothetical protein